MFILVAEVNDHNQYGKYYIDYWINEPNKSEVQDAIYSSDFYFEECDMDLVMDSIRDPFIDTRTKPTVGNDAWFSFIS